MTYTFDRSKFTSVQLAAFEKADSIATAYNAILFHELGAETYNELRAKDPALGNEHDYCDGNMVMLAALQVVLGVPEKYALKAIVAPTPQIADLISEIAHEKRETFSVSTHR